MKTTLTTPEEVGKRLQETRKSRGLSPNDVSKALRVSESTIINIEKGIIENYYPEIYAMICLYVKSTHEIFEGFFEKDKTPLYFLRDKTDDNSTENIEKYVLDCIDYQRRIHSQPIHISGISSSNNLRQTKKLTSSILEMRAQDLIQKHDLYCLPINIYQVAANLGVHVIFEYFPSNLYNLRGFCYKEEGFSLVGINKSHPVELQRFTLAHELHHLIYDSGSAPFVCNSSNESEVIEANAERFAAEILMPKFLIERLISNPKNVRYITVNLFAEHFKVSYQAAAIRLQNLGLVDNASEVCKSAYRKKDKEKTKFLIENKLNYLRAVFGLETGIAQLQNNEEMKNHTLCGSTIFNPNDTVCWYCGTEIREPKGKDFLINNPYKQNVANLSPSKVLSVDNKKDYMQLSLNLKV